MADLPELLQKRENFLLAQLGLGAPFDQPTAIGDVSEITWEVMLDEFLPGRYQVSRGAFLIDSTGATSTEMDVVIHDNYFHPLLYNAHARKFIPIESVYGVFEIKQSLTAEHVSQACAKAAEARTMGLNRTNLAVVHAAGEVKEPKPPLRILAGILTASSSWNPPFGESLAEALADAADNGELDLGLALTDGAFENTLTDGGEVQLESSTADGLMFFLTRLFTKLQRAGSVPAIDLRAYEQRARAEK